MSIRNVICECVLHRVPVKSGITVRQRYSQTSNQMSRRPSRHHIARTPCLLQTIPSTLELIPHTGGEDADMGQLWDRLQAFLRSKHPNANHEKPLSEEGISGDKALQSHPCPPLHTGATHESVHFDFPHMGLQFLHICLVIPWLHIQHNARLRDDSGLWRDRQI